MEGRREGRDLEPKGDGKKGEVWGSASQGKWTGRDQTGNMHAYEIFGRDNAHDSQIYKKCQTEGYLRRRKSSSERITTPERMAASKVGCRMRGQELLGMESGEE